jgi:hypothetical protein
MRLIKTIFSETFATIYQATQWNVPEHNRLDVD